MSTGGLQHNQLAVRRGSAVRILTRWLYLPDDPFTVSVAIDTGVGGWVEWAFARDLLITGLTGPAGLGDVQVRPERTSHGDHVVLTICSPDGRAVFELDRASIERFVKESLTAVPAGTESAMLDLDFEIAELTRCSD